MVILTTFFLGVMRTLSYDVDVRRPLFFALRHGPGVFVSMAKSVDAKPHEIEPTRDLQDNRKDFGVRKYWTKPYGHDDR